jgi:hypothetical protein
VVGRGKPERRKRVQNTLLAATRFIKDDSWVAVDMAHKPGGFKVFRAVMVSEAENSTKHEGLAAWPKSRAWSVSAATWCRKFSQIALFA